MRFILFALSFLLVTSLFAQDKYDYNWTLGQRGGVILNFEAEIPSVINYNEDFVLRSANAAISDKVGELLFYSNGCVYFGFVSAKDINSMRIIKVYELLLYN